jgi:hypothetical protein
VKHGHMERVMERRTYLIGLDVKKLKEAFI